MLLRRAAPMTPRGLLTMFCSPFISRDVRFSANSQILLEVHAAVAGGGDDTAWLRGIFDGFAAQGFRITALAPLLDGRLDALAVTLVKVGVMDTASFQLCSGAGFAAGDLGATVRGAPSHAGRYP